MILSSNGFPPDRNSARAPRHIYNLINTNYRYILLSTYGLNTGPGLLPLVVLPLSPALHLDEVVELRDGGGLVFWSTTMAYIICRMERSGLDLFHVLTDGLKNTIMFRPPCNG